MQVYHDPDQRFLIRILANDTDPINTVYEGTSITNIVDLNPQKPKTFAFGLLTPDPQKNITPKNLSLVTRNDPLF